MCVRTHTHVLNACQSAVDLAHTQHPYTHAILPMHTHTHTAHAHTFSPACQGIRYSSPLHEEHDPRLPHWLSFKERCVSVNIRYVRMMHFCVPRENRPPHKLPHYWRSDLPMLSSPVRNQVEKRNIRKLFPFCLACPHTESLEQYSPNTEHQVARTLLHTFKFVHVHMHTCSRSSGRSERAMASRILLNIHTAFRNGCIGVPERGNEFVRIEKEIRCAVSKARRVKNAVFGWEDCKVGRM